MQSKFAQTFVTSLSTTTVTSGWWIPVVTVVQFDACCFELDWCVSVHNFIFTPSLCRLLLLSVMSPCCSGGGWIAIQLFKMVYQLHSSLSSLSVLVSSDKMFQCMYIHRAWHSYSSIYDWREWVRTNHAVREIQSWGEALSYTCCAVCI